MRLEICIAFILNYDKKRIFMKNREILSNLFVAVGTLLH